jgi:DNA-binding transcriptional MerR regulator
VTAPVYKIKDVAVRSGFSPATLRYYEDIGLLPVTERTAAGYRLYDDATVERLGFIARAKQLGCSLDEIAELATAWDGGECGSVQDRLRTVVADKLTGAQRQIAELMTLAGDLRHAAAALERHRPEGRCDDSCGCVSDAAGSAEAVQAIALVVTPSGADLGDVPIACTLGLGSLRGRVEEWQVVLANVARREPLDGGVRAVFLPIVPLDELMRLIAAEQDCCRFLSFAITVDTRGVALQVTAPADALAIVHSLFGAPA